ncbi:MAG: hypothetical protein AAGD38_15120 [Acidobacteriota bacterium]
MNSYPTRPAIKIRTDHPLALVSAVRQALRHAGATSEDIDRFNKEARSAGDEGAAAVRTLCASWADLDIRPDALAPLLPFRREGVDPQRST